MKPDRPYSSSELQASRCLRTRRLRMSAAKQLRRCKTAQYSHSFRRVAWRQTAGTVAKLCPNSASLTDVSRVTPSSASSLQFIDKRLEWQQCVFAFLASVYHISYETGRVCRRIWTRECQIKHSDSWNVQNMGRLWNVQQWIDVKFSLKQRDNTEGNGR